MQILWVSLIMYNACKAMKLLIITWVHICISFNKLIWLMQKIEKIDILSLIFMPFTGNKSPGAKKGSDEWQCDNFTNIFWVKPTFNKRHPQFQIPNSSPVRSILNHEPDAIIQPIEIANPKNWRNFDVGWDFEMKVKSLLSETQKLKPL